MLGPPGHFVRASSGGTETGELVVPRALRPERLLGADRVRAPRGDRSRQASKQISISCRHQSSSPPTRAGGAREHTTYDPRHYLALLERKPGALDFARPLEALELPSCFVAACAGASKPTSARSGTREFIKVLRLMEQRHACASSSRRRRGGAFDRGHEQRCDLAASCSTAKSALSGCSAWTATRTCKLRRCRTTRSKRIPNLRQRSLTEKGA